MTLTRDQRDYAERAERGGTVLIMIPERSHRQGLLEDIGEAFPDALIYPTTSRVRFPSGGNVRVAAEDELPTLAGLHFEYILLQEGAPEDMAVRILSLLRKPAHG